MTFIGDYHFLTTKPLTRRIYEEQQEYLYVLAMSNIEDALLFVYIYYTDDTNANYSIPFGDMDKGTIKCVNIGYDVQDYKSYQPAKTIERIEIKMNNLLEKIILLPLAISTDEVREFHYFNSLGGLDSLVCTGEYKAEQELSNEIQRSDLSLSALMSDAEYTSTNGLTRESYEVLSGFKPLKEIEATKDMFLVNKVYELVKAFDTMAIIPIIIDQRSISYPASKSNLKSVNFKCRQAYDDLALDRIL